MTPELAFYVAGTVLVVVALAIGIEIVRLRARNRKPQPRLSRHPRRQPLLEDRMREAFEGRSASTARSS